MIATSNLDAALLSRMLLCHYAFLVTQLNRDSLGSPGLHGDAAAQALQLHSVLKWVPIAHIYSSLLQAHCSSLLSELDLGLVCQ